MAAWLAPVAILRPLFFRDIQGQRPLPTATAALELYVQYKTISTHTTRYGWIVRLLNTGFSAGVLHTSTRHRGVCTAHPLLILAVPMRASLFSRNLIHVYCVGLMSGIRLI